MLDRYLLEAQNALLRPVALQLSSRGVAADALTLIGFLFGVGSAIFIATGFAGTALILIALNRLFDGLDGAVARLAGPTDRGAFLDIALDFAFYAMVPLAFAVANPTQNAMAACLLLASFMGTASSFLAFAVIAAKRGATSTSFPQKGIYYLGGLTEGTETIVAFTAMCLWPNQFPIIATVFSVLALLTTMMRWLWGWREFSESKL
ncbi:CDP-alcohol phosphatidyltransferase family protein [Bradyrhizobium sp.]|uniref:CDP-alcohol phosphatidyltransferase family protein n=1 Tax=Bradyrhizobium sp. TaxID=376 RepID=UPI000A3E486E|nr:CDP-alcohol phosphatidyltransferase family protein [Bradyrhizobium sp.]